MNERETAGRLSGLRKEIYDNSGFWGADDLEDAVIAALNVAGPPGYPDSIEAMAEAIKQSSIDVDNVLYAVKRLRGQVLPAAWTGDASVAAGAALKALERTLERTIDTFAEASQVLRDHSQNLEAAQRRDRQGMGPLDSARDKLRGHTGWFDYDSDAVSAAHNLAITGINDRSGAANSARDSAERAAKILRDLAGGARVSQLSGSSLDPVSELVIADAGGGGDADELILTPIMADRAQDAINRLNPSDRQRLDQLLSNAKSPEEQAYILKAMGAGYNMDQVSRFDQMIHDHGDDPAWLKDRLSPLDNTDYSLGDAGGTKTVPTTHGQTWTQGPHPTCVASSNVMARANVDPIYALQLTTGGHPGDPAYDNPADFAQRLRNEQERVYDGGRPWTADLPWVGYDGMYPDQSEDIANEHIAPHTGVQYEDRGLDNNEERRVALQEAERAVDRGVPVPFNTSGHEMLIVGHDGDMVQIYNPWGYTVWMKEEDFISGNMNAVEQKTAAADIRLPR
ncbi:MAG TPA: WXG100 family type VII secretion target [Candidatus Limnocylindrales bacterium]|nr:WXG100 family type VII secretion target [Candidatus Limnocylindrales bacterium]